MMKRVFIAVLTISTVSLSAYKLQAQANSVASEPTNSVTDTVVRPENMGNNIIKINLFAFSLKTISLQYERIMNKYLSLALAGRYMPEAGIPYKNFVYKQIGEDDPDFKQTLDKMFISNFAITPELRFYLGKKGYGRGFYLAPAYRYVHFTLNNFDYIYSVSDSQQNSLMMSGNMTVNFGGFTIGAQWALGKHLSLDWWIFAPFFGIENTSLSGKIPEPLTEEEQNSLRESLDSIEIAYTSTTVSVHQYGASIQLHGLTAGLSAGLAFGVRF